MSDRHTVVAFAGRRIDAADAEVARFPLARVDDVRDRVRELLVQRRAVCLVSSAACGADLLALAVAAEMRIRRVVVLPFDTETFRRVSVTDRPGAERWGAAFDRVLRDVPDGDVIVLDGADADAASFGAAGTRILTEAIAIGAARDARVLAAVAWDGARRGSDDMTAQFLDEARVLRVETAELPTIEARDTA